MKIIKNVQTFIREIIKNIYKLIIIVQCFHIISDSQYDIKGGMCAHAISADISCSDFLFFREAISCSGKSHGLSVSFIVTSMCCQWADASL